VDGTWLAPLTPIQSGAPHKSRLEQQKQRSCAVSSSGDAILVNIILACSPSLLDIITWDIPIITHSSSQHPATAATNTLSLASFLSRLLSSPSGEVSYLFEPSFPSHSRRELDVEIPVGKQDSTSLQITHHACLTQEPKARTLSSAHFLACRFCALLLNRPSFISPSDRSDSRHDCLLGVHRHRIPNLGT
jgi:hypothetical protein